MFDYGLEAHRERQHELAQFRDAIDSVKQDNRQLAAAKVDEFMLYKRKVSQSPALCSSSRVVSLGFQVFFS